MFQFVQIHTTEFQKHMENQWEDFIPAKSGTLIGGLTFLKDWIVRSEMSNALSKIYVRDIKTNKEEELIITEEKVISPGVSLMQKNKETGVFEPKST